MTPAVPNVGCFTEGHVSLAFYEPIRWGAMWISRALGGWTPTASLALKWKGVTWIAQLRKDVENWTAGCPRWYVEHQP